MATTQPADWLSEAIRHGVKQRIREEARAIEEEAQRELSRRIARVVDQFALSAMGHYDIQMHGEKLTITVDKRALMGEGGE